MQKRMVLKIGIAVILLFAPPFSQANDFSKERALEHVRFFAETIGPRPMGSPQEIAALRYTAQKLAEYGCQVEWQPVTSLKHVNTSSFNVIGRFPGETAREIVVGGHIDSLTPEIPGADDDASGVAVVLETARVLCQKKHSSTLVFVAFCGEESGLVGSKNFVENYALKDVALMLQLDMASNDAPLMLWIDTPNAQSPEWLVRASIASFHELGYRNIDYPTHFQSMNGTLGGAGSDHEPFMDKGIPAIAFVSDVRFPIHTRNDSMAYFQPDGLERSGKVILTLVEKFDREQPKEKAGHYILVMAWGKPLFIKPEWLLAFIIFSILIGILTLVWARKKRLNTEEDKKIRLSWPKLSVMLFIIAITTVSSQWTMQLLKGQRLPWLAHPGPYFLYAFIFLFLGIWLALQVTRSWKLRKDVFFYLVRAVIYLGVLILVAGIFGGPRLALYPAAGLLLISLACLAPWAWLKALLWLLSPYLMFRLLILPEYYEFAYRTAAIFAFPEFKTSFVFGVLVAVFILFLFLWTMPFLLGFAAVYRSHSGDLFGLKRIRRPFALVPLGVLIIGCAVYLLSLPSYVLPWEQVVKVTQKWDAQKDKTSIEFSSGDYLRGIEADINGQTQVLNEWSCVKEIEYPLDLDWVKDKVVSQSEEKGAERIIDLAIGLEFTKQPYSVSLRLKSDEPLVIEDCNVKYAAKGKKSAVINWFSYPQGSLEPKLKLRLSKNAKIEAEVSATFLDQPVPVSCRGKNKFFVYRAFITRKINL
jgi:hypothetical protein